MVKVILGVKEDRGRPMKERYDIYFAGQILDGIDPISVRDKLAKLFKADKSTLNLLFSGKAVFDPSGGCLGYRGAVRDVTQQYDAKEALRESEIRFKNIAESSSDWIWVMDERLRFSYVSDRFYEITGLQSEDIIGKTRNEFVGAEVIAADSHKWQAQPTLHASL